MRKICVLDSSSLGEDINLEGLNRFGELVVYYSTSQDEVHNRIKDCEIIVTSKALLNSENLANAEALKLICITATGTNNVDLSYAKNRGITVTNVAGYSTRSVVQHTFAMAFNLIESMQYYDNYVKSGEYIKSQSFTHIGRNFYELNNKVWGIIGLGAIGKEVARIAKAFGCEVIYYSTSGSNYSEEYQKVSLNDLLVKSDIISIHAPLNEKTKNLFTITEFSKMKPSSILLNLGRGGIVNETDLAKALNENIIGMAGLDVLEFEPMIAENNLRNIVNPEKILITPHIAWASIESRERLMKEIELNIASFYAGEKRNWV